MQKKQWLTSTTFSVKCNWISLRVTLKKHFGKYILIDILYIILNNVVVDDVNRKGHFLCDIKIISYYRIEYSLDWYQQKCPQLGSTYRDAYPRSLRHADCETRVHRSWRYCGMCPHKCCYPASTRTVPMEVTCTGGFKATIKVMMFDYCTCAATCPDNY